MAKKMSSTRLAAGEALRDLALQGKDVVGISADTSKSMYTTLIREVCPERFIDLGIAEQNMVMVAAGLASTGKIPYVASYSVFTSMRCCEQLRTFAAYPGLNVKVIAGIGGLSAGIEGVTHVATEDLGIVRCIANMAVVAPSDYITTHKAVMAAADYQGPVYIRVGRDSTPELFDGTYDFVIGKPVMHRQGKEITLIGCGLIMAEVLEAARMLASQGIEAEVIEMHTLKPVLDPEMIFNSAKKTGRVITVEEHNIIGGLGTVVSEILCGRMLVKMKKLGLPDCFGESGTPEELVRKFGLDAENIVKESREILAA